MYFDKAKIIHAAREKEKEDSFLKLDTSRCFCPVVSRSSIHTNTKGQKEKPEEFQKLDVQFFLLFTK